MAGLLPFFVSQVATQVAVLISKVARVGLRDWPELFPALLQVCLHVANNKCLIYICICIFYSQTLLLSFKIVVNLLLEISILTQPSC